MLLVPLACNDADFGGSNSKSGPPAEDCKGENCGTGEDGDTPLGGPGGACAEGDKLNIAWTGPVKECILDQGKSYNFDLQKCAAMRQSKFGCDWETVTKELEDRGLLTDYLKSDRDGGAKLVSCGQSEDGNRIVVQWLKAPEGGFNCAVTAASDGAEVVTGCYTLYGAGDERPPAASSDEEKKKQVYDCMNRL